MEDAETFYRTLLLRVGIVGARVGDALHFSHHGKQLRVKLDTPQWLQIEHDALPLSNRSSEGLGAALLDLNLLNARHIWVRLWLDNDGIIRAGWTSFLFASVSPEEGDETPPIGVEQVLPVFNLALKLLGGAVHDLLALHRVDEPPPRWDFDKIGYGSCDALPLFAASLADEQCMPEEVGDPAKPEWAFRSLEAPWVYRLRLTGHRMGCYALALPFIEKRRFQWGSTLNVVACDLEQSILQLCNEITGAGLGCKAYAHLETGLVVVIAPGCVPPGGGSSFAAFMPALRRRLTASADALIAFLGCTATDFAAEAAARANVPPHQAGLIHHDRGTANRWERRSGRLIVERCLGQHGRLLSGFHVPTDRGEVEIDHILVCEFGILAVECKDYGGVIRGSSDTVWTQGMRGKARPIVSSRGRNPLEQSRAQVMALRRFIDAALADVVAPLRDRLFVIGVTLFPDSAELQLEEVVANRFHGAEAVVFTAKNLIERLNQPVSKPDRLTWQQIELVAGCILRA